MAYHRFSDSRDWQVTDENRIRLSALSRMHDDVEDYGFTYSDDEVEGEEDADVENQYYNSKGIPLLN